jgi:YfiH family protein
MTTRRPIPHIDRAGRDGLVWFTDERLARRSGIRIVFTTRLRGVSAAPYDSLDLASHSGDDPAAVDENRLRIAGALDLDAERLVTAEQVHGDRVVEVGAIDAGRGATVGTPHGSSSIPGCDALLTTAAEVPLLMMYADCVPVVLVAEAPSRGVCVVHAGWKGALAGLPGISASRLATASGCEPGGLSAYVGPCVCGSHYEVSEDLACAFHERYASSTRSVSILAAPARVDLAAAVTASLEEAGVSSERVAALGMCTVEEPTLFYSYRAEGVTGRHGALAAIRA